MEFRNCPSCKASVLEDDVADCPFCGASMSGKPSAKPTPKSTAGPAPSTAPGAAKPATPVGKGVTAPRAIPDKSPPTGSTRPRPPRDPEPEPPAADADPFEVDPLAHKQATQVSVKQAKGRTIEVKCPMCETVGFIAPSQAGKDVKCCNPSCKLPIFKSPKLPEAVQVEPEKARGLSITMLSLIAIAVVALGAGGVYYFVLKEEPKPIGPIEAVPVIPDNTIKNGEHRSNEIVEVKQKEITTVEEIRQLSLDEILKVAGASSIRSRPAGRQSAAEALLTVSNLEGAIEQIAKIKALGASSSYYSVEPLAILAQKQLDAGDMTGAETSLNEAVSLSSKLPDVGRSPLDAIAVLAATLVRLERSAEAVQLLGRYAQKDHEFRPTLSLYWRSSLDRGTFDFGKESTLSHLDLCGKPLWVSTAVHLCRSGQWDQAVAWSKSAPDAITQDASLAACAGMLASRQLRKPDPALAAQLNAFIDSAGLVARVRMKVAAAEVRFLSGDKGITAATATEIEQLLAATPIPPAATVPDLKAIYDSKGVPFASLPNPAPGTSLALAFADIADLQMKLGDTAAGWATQAKAMEVLRSVSPSPALAQQLVDQCAHNGEAVKNQLDTSLKLGNDGAKKLRALSQYRVQCEVIQQIANDRFVIQQTLLRRSMRYGLLQEVWQFAQQQEQLELNQREPYRSQTTLLTDLYYSARSVGNVPLATQFYNEYSEEEKKTVKKHAATMGTLEAAESIARTGDLRKAAEMLKPLYVGTTMDRHLIDRHVLGIVSEQSALSMSKSYSYIQRLADPTIKEDSLRLLAGLSIRGGQGPELLRLVELDRDDTSSDRIAMYLGYLEGIESLAAKSQ